VWSGTVIAAGLVDSLAVSENNQAGVSRDPNLPGPLDRQTAAALIERGDALSAQGDYQAAAAHYARVRGHADPDLHVAALLGLAESYYRLDNEPVAVQFWSDAARAPETPLSWIAWKQLAAAKVRSQDLPGALEAYRQADRRAPPREKAEIASRLGWLSKELGDRRAAGRYFGRSRAGGLAQPIVTYVILAVTIAIGVMQLLGGEQGDFLTVTLILDKDKVAQGELYRLLSAAFVHDWTSPLHLAFNMYALYIFGPLVERIFGSLQFILIYVLAALAASVASYIFTPGPSLGASGAIFGLFGVLFVALRVHHPLLGRQGRMLASQIGFLIVLNVALGFGLMGSGIAAIDNFAHLGGLAAGAWLGLVLMPSGIPTLSQLWQRPGAQPAGAESDAPGATLIRAIAVLALVAVIAAGVAYGTNARTGLAVHGRPIAAGSHIPTAGTDPAGVMVPGGGA
jgi:rhomboid protease GluP